ncbi:MAG: hypothetical protein IKP07_01675 [Bacilli bacterium]|nr:hypothetical protein [Bacilli bacterium]
MNVIVSNKYAAMLSNLNIDLIKSIQGEFQVDDLIAQFDNFFFNKMILDITAIVNYQDITQIQRLSFGMDMSKIILLLDDSPAVNSPQYLSELVSMGIYNFTRNIDAVAYLVDNPNSYKDVAQFHIIGNGGGAGPNGGPMPQQQQNQGNRKNVGNERQFINNSIAMPSLGGTRVIGFKDLTDHAGATTLIYMLKKQLSENYRVLGIELDKNDFLFFNDPEMKSCSSKELDSIIHNPVNSYDVILIDINNSSEEANCTEMLYLIEPSTLMLNKMVRRDRNIIEKIKGKKVILNRSLLDQNDIREFENEAGLSVFHCIPPLDDKMDKHRVLDELLNKLGFDKNRPAADSSRAARLFGIVKE